MFLIIQEKKMKYLIIPYQVQENKERNRNTDRKRYLLEFAGGFMIQVVEFHANSLNRFIRAYLSNYFNALFLILSSLKVNFETSQFIRL